MISFFVLIFIILANYEKKYGKTPLKQRLIMLIFSALVIFLLRSVISPVEFTLIIVFSYNFFSKNMFKSLKISFQLLTYFFLSFFLVLLVLPFIDLSKNYYFISLSLLIVLHLDLRFEVTDKLIKRYNHYMDLIYATYLFVTMILSYELRPNHSYTDTKFVLITSLTVFVYIYIITQLIDYTTYLNCNEEVEMLNEDVALELTHLIEKQNNVMKILREESNPNEVLSYLEKRKIPIYSNDEQLNFIMYYLIKHGNGYLNIDDLSLDHLDQLVYFLIEVLEKNTSTYTIASSPIDKNLIIIETERLEDIAQQLRTFKSKLVPKWQLSSLRYLFELEHIQVSFHFSDTKQIHVRW